MREFKWKQSSRRELIYVPKIEAYFSVKTEQGLAVVKGVFSVSVC